LQIAGLLSGTTQHSDAMMRRPVDTTIRTR